MSPSNVSGLNPAASLGKAPLVPSNIGSIVAADLEAMRNDLEQAHALAEDYRWQLAGKSNECAELRQLLEKTKSDLSKLTSDIAALRQDRHRLANEAMKAQEAERFAAENAKLRDEVEKLRSALQASKDKGVAKPVHENKPQTLKTEIIELDFNV